MKPWQELRSGVVYLHHTSALVSMRIGEQLDRIDRDRHLQGKPPCFAVVEVHLDQASAHLPWILERVTGSGPLRDARWRQPADAGLLYGPVRAAAWRTLDAKHFGLPERRSLFVLASAGIDPSFLFEPTGGRSIASHLAA